MTDDRKWHVAWAKFSAFRAHLPDSVGDDEVGRFHGIVKMLEEASGEDLSDFRIPDSVMKPVPVSFSRGTMRRPGHVTMSEKRYCNHQFFQQQVDGIVFFFESLKPPLQKP